MRGISLVGFFSSIALVAATAGAQTAPPPTAGSAPPRAAQPPPASTAPQPPPQRPAPTAYPGYPPQGAYPGYPPPGPYPPAAPRSAPPKKLAYHEGMTIPQGYHLESTVRKGPVIAGAVVLGVPYVIGLATAAGSNYSNSGGWLAVPLAGPWLTLGIRKHTCAAGDTGCEGDEALIRTFLVLDAIMQTTGGAFLIWGIADKKEYLLRDDVVRVIGVAPTRIGSGYGIGMFGTF